MEDFETEIICLSPAFSFNLTVYSFTGNSLRRAGFECFEESKEKATCSPCRQGYYGRRSGGCQSCPQGGYYQDDIAKVSNNATHIECKKCNPGTYVRYGKGVSSDNCVVCPDGTDKTRQAGLRACFCMDGYARTNRFSACQLCENEGLNCTGGDYKKLKKGYYWNWNYPEANPDQYEQFVDNIMEDPLHLKHVALINYTGDIPNVHKCPRTESCSNSGSNITGTCAAGYEGLLCTKCMKNHYLVLGQCLECPELVYRVIVIICIFFLFLSGYLVLLWQYRKQKRYREQNERTFVDIVVSRAKIVLGFYQVVGEFFRSLHEMNWAGTLFIIGEFITTVKFNILRIFIRPNCYVDFEINAKLEFIIAMTFLAFVVLVPCIFYQTKKFYFKFRETTRNPDSETLNALRNTKSQLLFYVLAILFLTYPPICTIIFQLYPGACKTFCWDGNSKYCPSVLRSDFAIDCNTLGVYQGFAILATVVYVIAFPLSLLFLLWRKRNELSTHDQISRTTLHEGEDTCYDEYIFNGLGDDTTRSNTPFWLAFLCENYKTKCWFWEVLELVRKVTQTVLITLLGWENRVTVLLTIGLSVLFLVLHAMYLPMKNSFEQKLQMFALTAILMNVLIAAFDHDDTEERLTVFLIVLNLAVILIVIGELLLGIFHLMRKLKVYRKSASCTMSPREGTEFDDDVEILMEKN